MALWIKFFQASAQYANRVPADVQRRAMGRAIDPQGQATGDHKSCPGQAAGKGCGGVHARTRSVATTDQGQLGFFQNAGVAGDEQQRRRIRQFGQQRGITGLVPHQQLVIAPL